MGSDVKEDFILIDSGCTSHIENKDFRFESFKSSHNPQCHYIQLADGHKIQGAVQGVGSAHEIVEDKNGVARKVELKDALFIPNFNQDILSVYKTVKSGHTITFSPQGSSLITRNGTIFDIVIKDKLFYIKRAPKTSEKHMVNKLTDGKHSLEEWHSILGHCNKADAKKLASVINGMKITDFSDFECETCLLGKMTQHFNRNPRKCATGCLDLVHCDLMGPINPSSREGFKYTMSFVDDHSGVIKIYLLKRKSDAIIGLQRFLTDTASFGQIRRLRLDNAAEFSSREFRGICLQNKIKMEFSSPYSPHQNGTVERSHRTILNMARCLLLEAKLPKTMWTFAVKMAAMIRNRCFNSRTGFTPIELLTGKRSDLSNLKIFGSKCYAHNHDHGKLDPRCIEGLFVGYDQESPAYLVYIPSSQTVRKIREVHFLKQTPEVLVHLPEHDSEVDLTTAEPENSSTTSNIEPENSSSTLVTEPKDDTDGSSERKSPFVRGIHQNI